MNFYVNLFFGIIFISTASKISSQCIDKIEIEKLLSTNNEKIMSEVRNLSKSLHVQLSTVNLIYEKVNKPEGASVSSIEKISSEGENLKSALGNDTSNDTLTYDREEHIGTENLILLKLEEIISRINVDEDHLNKIDVNKPIERSNFFLTPELNYESAVEYCHNNDARPFIPKKQEHLDFYIELSSGNRRILRLAWYPLNDIEEEGHLVYQDGTDFRTSWFKIKAYGDVAYRSHKNDDEFDCVGMDGRGHAGWIRCEETDHVMVCQRN